MHAESASTPKVVKRYANRKLYDTERSCYVTLEDISVMIKAGDEVRVIDNKTGEDLTSVTLAQIIFETEKKKSFMPLSLLRGLIQERSDAWSEYAKDQVEKAQARAHELIDSANHLRESAQKIRTGLEERLERVINRKSDKDGDEAADESQAGTTSKVDASGETVSARSDDTIFRPKLLLDLVAASRETFDAVQQGVEQRVKDGVHAVSRNIGVEVEDIRKRMVDLEHRLEKFLQ